MTDDPPTTPLLPPGSYRFTWTRPPVDQEKAPVLLAGEIELHGDRPPVGTLYGDVPLLWANSEHGSGVEFPQEFRYPAIRAQLHSGAGMVLLDATVVSWVGETADVHAAVALIAPYSSLPEPLEFGGMKIQITGLHRIAGRGPIASFQMPTGAHGAPRMWSLTEREDVEQRWEDEGVSLVLGYDRRTSISGAFGFSYSCSPVITVQVPEPLALEAWLSDWVEPLRRVIALLAGSRQEVTYLGLDTPSVGTAEVGWPNSWTSVYGAGITQSPYVADDNHDPRTAPVLTTAAEGVSLLALVRAWQAGAAEHHPLVETYGAFLAAPPQHPRSRFLQLVQALEGFHGYVNRATKSQREAEHTARRNHVLADIEKEASSIEAISLKFIKRFLSKKPKSSLADAIRSSLGNLPVDLSPELELTKLVREVRAETAEKRTMLEVVQVVRNDLAHGNRGYDTESLAEVADIMERVTRAHLLQLLGCPDTAVQRALQGSP